MKDTFKSSVIITLLLFLLAQPTGAEDQVVQVNISPAKAVYGTPFQVVVSGLRVKDKVTITAESVDKRMIKWQASAVYMADHEGVVDLSRQAPVGGDYMKKDVYGLLWSMKPINSKRKQAMYSYDLDLGLQITIRVRCEGGKIVQAKLFRYYEDPDRPLYRIVLNHEGLKGTLFSPDNRKRYPGVILLSGSNGGSVHWLAKAIAVHGFSVLDIPYFKYPGLPKNLINIPLEYFYKAIQWMKQQKSVQNGKIGMIGGSRGGELALQLASMFDEFKAVVAWVPAAHLWQGEDYEKLAPTWTWRGKPLPFIGEAFSKEELQKFYSGKMTSYREYFIKVLKNLDPVSIKKAAIKVENIKAPLLLVSGTEDQTWPATEFCHLITKRLKTRGFGFTFSHLNVKDAGHLVFLPDFIPGTYRHFNGGTREAELHGSIKSWNDSIRFLHQYLDHQQD
jgi:dienelactone hydrolase